MAGFVEYGRARFHFGGGKVRIYVDGALVAELTKAEWETIVSSGNRILSEGSDDAS